MADSPDHNVSHTLAGIYIASKLGLCVIQTWISNFSATCGYLNIKSVNITTCLTNTMDIQNIQSSGSSISYSVFLETFNERDFFLTFF